MSRAASSAKFFAVYLLIVASILVVAPNVLLGIFGIAPTTEVWIRLLGVVVFNLGVYVWVAARNENRPFLEASVYTRVLAFVMFSGFALSGLGDKMLILFGIIDLCGAMWTQAALRADRRSLSPA